MAFTLLFMIFVCVLLGIPGYILTGISLYSIAQRRGIDRPWQAWVPGMNLYILACISDQYQAIVKGKQKDKRAILLLLILVQLAAFCAISLGAFSSASSNTLLFLLIFIPAWCAGAAMTVVSLMALYDVYVSCDPRNAVLFLVLSIVFSVTCPFFLFACRKKDLGFPL